MTDIPTATIYSTLPPRPSLEEGEPHPDFITPTKSVSYDDDGRITCVRTQAVAFVRQEIASGMKVALGEGHWDTHYVDARAGVPTIVARPPLAQEPNKTTLAPGEEAILLGLPAAKITFSGPVTGSDDHPGGADYSIGWTVPGEYLVSIEAFPALMLNLTFTVTR